MTHSCNPASSAEVDFVVSNNETFGDSIQFDPPVAGVTGPAWTLSNQKFIMNVAANYESAGLLSLTSASGQIIVDDVTTRVIHFNVPKTVISAALIPGEYVYDFVMFDNAVPPREVQLMHGAFTVVDKVPGV